MKKTLWILPFLFLSLWKSALAFPEAYFTLTPEKGDLQTHFEVDASDSKNAKGGKGNLEYKFQKHEKAKTTPWQKAPYFYFTISEKELGPVRSRIFRARLWVKDIETGEIDLFERTYKVFKAFPRRVWIEVSNYYPAFGQKVYLELKVYSVPEDRISQWRIRWDFEGDGVWDTPFERGNFFVWHVYDPEKPTGYPMAEIEIEEGRTIKVRASKKVMPKKDFFHVKTLAPAFKAQSINVLEEDFKSINEALDSVLREEDLEKRNLREVSSLKPLSEQVKITYEPQEEIYPDTKVIFHLKGLLPKGVLVQPDFEGDGHWDLNPMAKDTWWWVYKKSGSFLANFRLMPPHGAAEEIEVPVNVLPPPPPFIVKVKVSHKVRRVWERFLLDASETQGEGLTFRSFHWKVPEGPYKDRYGPKLDVFFRTPGEKIIELEVTDKKGRKKEVSIPLWVLPQPTQKQARDTPTAQNQITFLGATIFREKMPAAQEPLLPSDFRVSTGEKKKTSQPKSLGMRPGW